jgi:hypothetical protein
MKVINKIALPRVCDYIFGIPVEEIVPGDKLIINYEHLLNTSYWKVVTVPSSGIIITKSGKVLIEGDHTENFRIDWLPKSFNKYFFGLISFDSSETENFILEKYYIEGKFDRRFYKE